MKQNSTVCGVKASHNVTLGPLDLDPLRTTRTLPMLEDIPGLNASNIVHIVKAFDGTRIHCSRCRWMFLNAAAQPYVLQAAAILLFLIGCIIFNFTLEDLFNKIMKKAPPRLLPCLFPPDEALGPRELQVGVTVMVPSAEWYLAAAAREHLERKKKEEERKRKLQRHRRKVEWAVANGRSPPPLSPELTPMARSHEDGDKVPVLQLPPASRRRGSVPPAEQEGDSGDSCYSVEPSPPGSPKQWQQAPRDAAPALTSPEAPPTSDPGMDSTAARHAMEVHTLQPPSRSSSVSDVAGSTAVAPATLNLAASRDGHYPPLRRPHGRGSVISSPPMRSSRRSRTSSRALPAADPTSPDVSAAARDIVALLGSDDGSGGVASVPRLRSAGRGVWGSRSPPREGFSPDQHPSSPEFVGAYSEHGQPPRRRQAPPGRPITEECLRRARAALREAEPTCELVSEYEEHGAPENISSSPLLQKGDGPASPFASPRAAGFNDDDFANDHEMCVVCGRDDAEKGTREGGVYRCAKPRECSGVVQDVLLEKASGMQEDSVAVFALAGALGQFGDVVGLMTKRGVRQALVAFRRPRAWIRGKRVVDRLRNWERRETAPDDPGPTLRVEERELEGLWIRILRNEKKKQQNTKKPEKEVTRFIVTDEAEDGAWRACELLGAVHVWLPVASIVKISDWGGPFCRVCEKEELQAIMKETWKKWYSDFELCVGQVRRIQRSRPADELADGELGTFEAVVAFKGSAVIVFPLIALKRCSEAQHDAEYLITPQPVVRRAMMGVFVASTAPVLALKGIWSLATFFTAVSQATADGHGGMAGHHSIFGVYEEVYYKLMNSGYPTLVADCGSVTFFYMFAFSPTREQFVAGVGKPIIFILLVSLLLCLPGMLSHALPMVVYYIWLWLPVWFFSYCVFGVVQRFRPSEPVVDPDHWYDMFFWMKHHKLYLTKVGLYYLVIRVLAQLLVVIFMQTNYNYAVLAYRGKDYFGTIPEEFNSRQMACVLEQALNAAALVFGGST
eukprot:TRINITY_DN3270_c0_g1_i1.p1 TRINITY_DN3270_c0_g1~~TRINITY_DN3270_c0_g1_i1.p1  ORF type:complete len:1016 (+),score=295.62 TRINITY_DN3270_c0_g1_i1:450-3497(+)